MAVKLVSSALAVSLCLIAPAHAQEGVLDVPLGGGDHQRVRAPALVVANRDDACNVAPPQAARQIAAAMSGSRDVRVLMVSGGVTRSAKACGSLSPHGYYGIETKVVDAIAAWMDPHI